MQQLVRHSAGTLRLGVQRTIVVLLAPTEDAQSGPSCLLGNCWIARNAAPTLSGLLKALEARPAE